MRIIAGIYKGRVLETVRDLSVRPATSRVRETLFNMLVHRLDFGGLCVLDAFAGSGSLGFEALSRGAEHVTFVETDRKAAAMIDATARKFGCSDAVDIVEADALSYMQSTRDRFGVIFADPPYAFEQTHAIPDVVFRETMLQPDGYLLVEHASSLRFEEGTSYSTGPEKRFGRTVVTFFQHKEIRQ